jgi:hypothetical protein
MRFKPKQHRFLAGAIFFASTIAMWVAAFEFNQLWLIAVAFAVELLMYWWLTK